MFQEGERMTGALPGASRVEGALSSGLLFEYHPSRHGPLAQLAEQQTLNLRVEGSIPSRLTIFLLHLPSEPSAKVAELVYALDLGSSPERSGWGFESPLSHQERTTSA